MSKPALFAVLAMLFYAIANVVLEQKFSRFNNLTLMCVYVAPIMLVAIIGRAVTKTSDPTFDFPVGFDLMLLIAVGFIWAAADYFYVGAFTNGGSLLTVTSIMLLSPVVASIIKFAWVQGVPNVWQIGGYFLAVSAVLMVIKGSSTT